MREDKKTIALLLKLYSGVGVAYLALAVITIFIMGGATFPLNTTFWTSNDLASQTSTVFAIATRNLNYVAFKWSLVFLLVFSLILPVLFVVMNLEGEQKRALRQLNLMRWIDWNVSGTIMLLVVSALVGVQDLMTFVLIAGLSVISYLLIRNSLGADKSQYRINCVLGKISGLLPYLLILIYIAGTFIFGEVRSPWFVYVLLGVSVINIVVMLLSHRFKNFLNANKLSNLKQEQIYLSIISLIKVSFSVVLILGLRG